MKKEILNRVENSSLKTIDLDSLIPNNPRIIFDIKNWLKNDLILIEKDFRELVKNHNWDQYSGKFVSIQCSNDAIVPDWAYMLISKSLKELEIENFIGIPLVKLSWKKKNSEITSARIITEEFGKLLINKYVHLA